MGRETTPIAILAILLLLSSMPCDKVQVSSSHVSTRSTNPFTHRAFLLRYWTSHVATSDPPPTFILSKSSHLNATVLSYISKLLSTSQTNSSLFCSLANLYCSSELDSRPTLSTHKVRPSSSPSDFTLYSNRRFSNYGSTRISGLDSFKNYSSTGLNSASDSFLKYGRDSTTRNEAFSTYSNDANVANTSFGNYGFGATGGSGKFADYHAKVNVPGLLFTTYDSDGNNHNRSFSTYSSETNSGSEKFTSYGKKGNGVPSEFVSYSEDSNIVDTGFTGYGELGNGGNDSFKEYGRLANDPNSNFKEYGSGGNAGVESFVSYRERANVGKDMFVSYERSSSSGSASFREYGKSLNPGNDTFKEYGKGSRGKTTVTFNEYGTDRSFNGYMDKGVRFGGYGNASGTVVNSRWVEPGRFFREAMLREGSVMVMPDIKDKMPKRSFLPRKIVSSLPFSTGSLSEIRSIFGAAEGSVEERVIVNALSECERPSSAGETKRCVGSVEDMIDFAVAVLGRRLTVKTTENVNGSTKDVAIGSVRGVNGGRVTESVSCHQSMYPYLLYYCHSVPNVRVYEADILDLKSKSKINHGVAICHLDTSAWGPEHVAFLALGSKPGDIEVCHWIFENDMTWTIADN